MRLHSAAGWISLLSAVTLVPACTEKKLEVEKTQAPPSLWIAESFDACLENASSCLKAFTGGDVSALAAGFSFVKLQPDSRVFSKIELARIRPPDLKSLEGAAFFTSLSALAKAKKEALEAGFQVPEEVFVDAHCTLPFAENNAYFRSQYGFESQNKKTLLKKVLCLGLLFDGRNLVSLATDRFVVAHEYFHALFAHQLLKEDGELPDEALSYSHDLDAYNEGLADFFAERVTQGTLSRVFGDLLPWRTRTGRKLLPEGLSGDIYRDGARYSELFSQLDALSPALPVAACSLKSLAESLRTAKKDALVRDLYFSYDVFVVDILQAIESCVPAEHRAAAHEIVQKQFPEPNGKTATEADLAVVVAPSLQALCGLQKSYELKPTEFRKYHFLDACSGVLQASWKDQEQLKMALTEPDAYGVERRLFETVYVLPGVRLTNGEGMDCRLRGLSNITTPEVALLGDFGEGESLSARFHNVIFQPLLRGSWYRDVPLGDFHAGTKDAESEYSLSGPLQDLSAQGYHFTSQPTVSGRPQSGFNGYFWWPARDLDVIERSEKFARLSHWVHQTFAAHGIESSTGKLCQPNVSNCMPAQNFDVVCRSHSKPMRPESLQPGEFTPLTLKNIEVFVWDCPQGAEGTCQLKKY